MSTTTQPIRSRMFTPLVAPTPPPRRDDPAHWHPAYEEPIYAAVYAERREQLLAALQAGVIVGELVTT